MVPDHLISKSIPIDNSTSIEWWLITIESNGNRSNNGSSINVNTIVYGYNSYYVEEYIKAMRITRIYILLLLLIYLSAK